MKLCAIMLIILLASCGRESSPEGRMQIRVERLEQKVDSLVEQNKAAADNILNINKELRAMKRVEN